MSAFSPAAGWLVVGVGRHVDRFGLPALARARGAEPVGLAGTDPVRTAELAARHGVGRWSVSLEELLGDERVTHVYVSSANDRHERDVALAAAAGKAVLCEKPLAGDSTAASRMVANARAQDIPLGAAFHLRHNEAHIEARRLIENGAVGRVLEVEVVYLHAIHPGDDARRLAGSRDLTTPSGGSMAGAGAHALDLAGWLAGSRIARLSARMAELDPTSSGPQRVIRVVGATESGVLVSISTGRVVSPVDRITITGEAGTIAIAGSVGPRGGGRIVLHAAAGDDERFAPPRDVYAAQFEHFAQAVAEGRVPEASGADGVAALCAAEAVEAALTIPGQERAVVLPEPLMQGAS